MRPHHHPVAEKLPGITLAVLAIALLGAPARRAVALPVHAGAGLDYSSGPGDDITRSAMGFASVDLHGADAVASVMRYDDGRIGDGTALIGGVGLGMGPLTRLRVIGTRFIGDGNFRGWRLKAGPQISLTGGPTIELFYSRDDNTAAGRTQSALGEVEFPLAGAFSGHVNASYTALGQGQDAWQGAVGTTWRLPAHLELSGEVGTAQLGAQGSVPRAGLLDSIPILGGGGGGSAGRDRSFTTTAAVGLRMAFH